MYLVCIGIIGGRYVVIERAQKSYVLIIRTRRHASMFSSDKIEGTNEQNSFKGKRLTFLRDLWKDVIFLSCKFSAFFKVKVERMSE